MIATNLRSSFFFFNQKTAYEMLISDWSSDVCSSDLTVSGNSPAPQPKRPVVRYRSSCAAKPSRVAAGFAFKSAKSSKTRLQRPARSSSVSDILTTDIVVSGLLAHNRSKERRVGKQ